MPGAGNAYQNEEWNQWESAGQGGYDQPAQGYDDRLAAASSAESSAARDLWKRNRAASERQLAQQTALAQRDISGMGASGGPSMLRASAYGSGQVAQQASTEGALQRQIEDQAMRDQLSQVYGRRGEYGMWGQQFAADQYSSWAEMEAYKKKKEAEEAAAEAAADAQAVGMVAGVMTAGLAGGI